MKSWYMIPVRGGSRGIPYKNKKSLNGKPLMSYVIDTISSIEPPERIVVATDDDELKAIALGHGVNVCLLPPQDGVQTLDDIAVLVDRYLQETLHAEPEDLLLTVQATCPFVKAETILKAKEMLSQGAGSVLTVTDAKHLHWNVSEDGTPVPAYEKRVNRQSLPEFYRESGAVWFEEPSVNKQVFVGVHA